MIISPSLKKFEKRGARGDFYNHRPFTPPQKSNIIPLCQRWNLDLPTLPLSKGRDLSHVEKDRFILSLQPNIKTIDRLAILFFASGNQCSTPALVFDGRQQRVALICRLITKINSRIGVHEHATRKNCDIGMRSLYGCVRAGHSPWFDGFE